MLFFPFKVDIPLSRIPILTILISISCLIIYWQQESNEKNIVDEISSFCIKQDERMYKVVMKKFYEGSKYTEKQACNTIFSSIVFSNDVDKTIADWVKDTSKFSIKSKKQTHVYLDEYLHKKNIELRGSLSSYLTPKLWYDPSGYNVISMITSVFSHGSWSHVIGNLFFFFAFAAAVEIIIGSGLFLLVILGLAVGTNLSYALAVKTSVVSVPTLGLSGVVMGMIGMFVYFIPKEKIRCFFWFIIWVRKFSVPAWILAVWYFGWDVYGLYSTGTSTNVNLIAHVSGFIQGFLIGLVLFRWRKRELVEEIKHTKYREQMHAVMKK